MAGTDRFPLKFVVTIAKDPEGNPDDIGRKEAACDVANIPGSKGERTTGN
jgi:hypothetical protein